MSMQNCKALFNRRYYPGDYLSIDFFHEIYPSIKSENDLKAILYNDAVQAFKDCKYEDIDLNIRRMEIFLLTMYKYRNFINGCANNNDALDKLYQIYRKKDDNTIKYFYELYLILEIYLPRQPEDDDYHIDILLIKDIMYLLKYNDDTITQKIFSLDRNEYNFRDVGLYLSCLLGNEKIFNEYRPYFDSSKLYIFEYYAIIFIYGIAGRNENIIKYLFCKYKSDMPQYLNMRRTEFETYTLFYLLCYEYRTDILDYFISVCPVDVYNNLLDIKVLNPDYFILDKIYYTPNPNNFAKSMLHIFKNNIPDEIII
jgi:hypothetical protein